MNLIEKIFGSYSKREINKILPTIDKIEEIEKGLKNLTDEDLKNKTEEFKNRLKNGETLEDILPEAFATVAEASSRVLGMRHFRVQLIGGMILHQGRIAEMKTGEGKTLVATLPVYLNALSGKGVHVVTVNDYLAKRDGTWMGKLYKFLGLSVGIVLGGMNSEEKRKAYACDIIFNQGVITMFKVGEKVKISSNNISGIISKIQKNNYTTKYYLFINMFNNLFI